MKFIYALPLFLATNAYAELNDNVNWSDISSTPSVDSQAIVQDFVPAQEGENSLIKNELANFDFLEKSIDERVFYSFNAKVRVLDKYTDEITDYDLNEINSVKLGKFNLSVKSCAVVQVNHVDNQFAFVHIDKHGKEVFKGWMSNINKNFNFPQLAEIYVNLISCEKNDNPTVEEAEKQLDETLEDKPSTQQAN
jgi:hypothetical protein